jgi:imidazoleglycerol-phosphate dehydratase
MQKRTKKRFAELETRTKETRIKVRVNIDGDGVSHASTGTKFLDHMITGFSTHSLIDIDISAEGDLRHHIIEDTALALGKCLSKALGDRKGIVRFGFAYAPMDESLAFAAIDLVKRRYFVCNGLELKRNYVEDLAREDVEHFFSSLCDSLECTMHLRLEYGKNDHHKIESCFKALALSLRRAVEIDPRRQNLLPSSKGKM